MSDTAVWQSDDYPYMALVKQFTIDQLTPIGAFLRLRPLGARVLLESVEGDLKVARYSFIGVGTLATMYHREGKAVVEGPGITLTDPSPATLLRKANNALRVPVPDSVELPYSGGAVGYFSYDWVRRLERLPALHPHPEPNWEWVWPEVVLAFDHHRHLLTCIVEAPISDSDRARERLAEVSARLRGCFSWPEPTVERLAPLQSNLDRDAYHAMVERAREHIFAGDIFQVVLAQKLITRVTGDPLQIYRRLRLVNPSPYLFYFEGQARTLVGASPESLIRVQNGTVVNRPIAGTRRRGANTSEDLLLWKDLIEDPKERSEHTMLVDLARNDLGRVSRFGTVEVPELMVRENYSHVMHIASEVRGQLRPEFDALDALAASFPAGTLSGAPKVRAMEIIEELEPEARGVYGGVVGYFSHRGDLDTCIAIRTLEVVGDQVTVQAGGGVVADSNPEAELQESLNKAAAAISVLDPREVEWL